MFKQKTWHSFPYNNTTQMEKNDSYLIKAMENFIIKRVLKKSKI